MDNSSNEPSEDYQLKVLGYKWDFLKFFLGTVVLGIATAVSTYIFKSYELKIEARKAESTYLQPYFTTFLEVTKNNQYQRGIDMADFLRLSAVDEDLKKAWTELAVFLKMKLDTLEKNKTRLDTTSKQLSQAIGQKHSQIKNLKDKLKVDKKYTAAIFVQDSAKLAKEVAEEERKLLQVTTQKAVVTQELKVALSTPASEYLTIYDQDRWAGEGYLNQITPEIIVNIDEYDKRTNKVSLRIVVNGGKREYTREIGGQINDTFEDGKYRIVLTLLAAKNMGSGVFSKLTKEVSYHIKVDKRKEH